MRLLERKSNGGFCLTKNLLDEDIVHYSYAILSHRWGADDEEVKFEDIESGSGQRKAGYKKLEFCGEQAQKDGLKYFWVDSCCIKKSSDPELSEAINSMYRWYSRAERCYVYLSDVSTRKGGERSTQETWELSFKASNWFSRGWTLQELLAPRCVEFYSQDHKRLGDKISLSKLIHAITGIALSALQGTSLSQFSVDERFKWAENRQTTRQEDWAYCLLGIFDISMPVIYGEGRRKALNRLRKEINESSNNKDEEPALETLRKSLPTATDAPFNSFAKQHEPYCLPRTRIDLLKTIYEWADGSDGRFIFWLSGWAGTGKSTIARTVARRHFEQRTLGASFFFTKGGGDVGNATKFVTSIAMQLASNVRALHRHISDALSEHSDIASLALRDQWQTLVLGPLSKFEGDARRLPYVLVIDALDECDNERDINTVLQIVADSQTSKGAKLRVFLTSRPETSIRYRFSQMSDSEHQTIILHNISKSIVDNDITVFLQTKFTDIAQERSFKSGWPGGDKLGNMVQIAGGLFIWAATACKFIREGQRFAEKRLDRILSSSRSTVTAPEQQLDAIYNTVLEHSISLEYDEEEKNEAFRILREVLGSIAVIVSPLSVSSLSNLLSLPEEDISQTLDDLHSVIEIPKDNTRPLRLHHASLRDFLTSKDRCKSPDFWIDESHAHQILAARCLQLMSDSLKQDICGVKQTGKFAISLSSSQLEQHIPLEVQYACAYWIQHLQKSGMLLCDDDQVVNFLKIHFLHWLEALGWMRQTHEGVLSIITLESMALASDSSSLYALIHDLKRFALFSRSLVEQAPLQVYSSLLVFAPTESLVRKQFVRNTAQWIEVSPAIAEERNAKSAKLESPSDSMKSAALFATGKQLTSHSLEKTTRLYIHPWSSVDTKWNACLMTLGGHTGTVHVVTLSPNDELLASVSSDCTVRLWNTRTGMLQYTFEGHDKYVQTVEFSPDGQLVASGSWDQSVKIWDVATGEMRHNLDGHLGWVNKVLFIRDGQFLASASEDCSIGIWHVGTGELNTRLEGHTGPIKTLATNSQLLASGSKDGTIRLWDTQTSKFLHSFEGHASEITSIAFSAKGELLCSASADKTVRLWNIERLDQCALFRGHTDTIYDVKFSPNDVFVASCSIDKSVRLWDVMGRQQRAIHRMHSAWVRTLLFSPDGQYIISGSDDTTICHWNLESGNFCCSLDNHGGAVSTLAMSRDGRVLASGSSMGSNLIRLWDMHQHGVSKATREGDASVKQLLLSPNGELVASMTWRGTIQLWDVKTAQCLQRFENLHYDTTLQGFSPNSHHLLFTSRSEGMAEGDWSIYCFHIDSSKLERLEGHKDRIEGLKFSPDGQLWASCSADQTTQIWQLEPHKLCGVYENATFNKLILSLPEGSVKTTWETSSKGTAVGLTTYDLGEGHSHWGTTPIFSADGQFLATTSKSGDIQLWDTKTGESHPTPAEIYKDLILHYTPHPALRSESNSLLSFDRHNQWVSYAGTKIVQIPAHYAATEWVAHDNTIVLGCESGEVAFLSFSIDTE